MDSWSVDRVCEWLTSPEVGLAQQQIPSFREAGVDGSLLVHLDSGALEELGIPSGLARAKLLKMITVARKLTTKKEEQADHHREEQKQIHHDQQTSKASHTSSSTTLTSSSSSSSLLPDVSLRIDTRATTPTTPAVDSTRRSSGVKNDDEINSHMNTYCIEEEQRGKNEDELPPFDTTTCKDIMRVLVEQLKLTITAHAHDEEEEKEKENALLHINIMRRMRDLCSSFHPENEAHRLNLIECGGVQVVLDAMMVHMACESFAEDVCALLGRISFKNEDAKEIARSNGGVSIAISILRTHGRSNEYVTEDALVFLFNICAKVQVAIDDANAQGVVKVVLDALRAHESNEFVVRNAFLCLTEFCCDVRDAKEMAHTQRGVMAAIKALQTQGDNEEVCEGALSFLFCMCSEVQAANEESYVQGGIQLALATLRHHEDKAQVVSDAFAYLFSMCLHLQAAREVGHNEGGVTVALDVLRSKHSNKDLITCNALLFLSYMCIGVPAAREEAHNEGGVMAALDTLNKNSDDAKIVMSALSFLCNMSLEQQGIVVETAHTQGGVLSLIKVLATHGKDANIIDAALLFLGYMCYEIPDACVAAYKGGVVDHILHAIRTHETNASINARACRLIYYLSVAIPELKMNKDVICALQVARTMHQDNENVQEACEYVFNEIIMVEVEEDVEEEEVAEQEEEEEEEDEGLDVSII